MFSTFRHYPIFELLFSNSPIALIITRNRQLKIYKVKPVLGKFFFAAEGWFALEPRHSLAHFKQRVYLYDANNINPLPATLLAKLEELSKSGQYAQFMSGVETLKANPDAEDAEALKTLEPVRNIDPTAILALRDFAACDPQTLAVGTAHIMQVEKLLKKRSQSVTATFPLKLIFIIIGVVLLAVAFGPDIAAALDLSDNPILSALFGSDGSAEAGADLSDELTGETTVTGETRDVP